MFNSADATQALTTNKIVIKIKRSTSLVACEDNETTNHKETNFEICHNTEPDTMRSQRSDLYCWICHFDTNLISCQTCQRKFHNKCLIAQIELDYKDPTTPQWSCYECQRLKTAIEEHKVLKKVSSRDQFYEMIQNAVNRLKYNGSEPFQTSVDSRLIPDYTKYVVNPMDISVMDKKIKSKKYVCLEELLQDMKWIVHNCNVFNGAQSKLTTIAKSLLRMLNHEISEIEVCADCYLNSIQKSSETWFTEPCKIPHLLVYAKIRSFPYWPAKALRVVGTELDVRFFGAHDRAMVPIEKCYWLSQEPPCSPKTHQTNIQRSVVELNLHIEQLKNKFGPFKYAEIQTPVDVNNCHIFLEDLSKDITCLPVITESVIKYGRNRRSTNMITPRRNPNTTESKEETTSSSVEKASKVSKKSEVISGEVQSVKSTDNRTDLATKSSDLKPNSQSCQAEPSTSIQQVQTELKRSNRLRKYSNLSPSDTSTKLQPNKRKSNMSSLDSSFNQDSENSNCATGSQYSSKRSRTDSVSKTEASQLMNNMPEVLKEHLTVNVSDPNETRNEPIEELEDKRDERIKELRRIEKVLLEEKKQLELLEKEQVNKLEKQKTNQQPICKETMSGIKNPPHDSTTSPKRAKMSPDQVSNQFNSPIRIKISLNNQDSKSTTSSLLKRTNKPTSPVTDIKSSPVLPSNSSEPIETVKVNIAGELVRNLKTDVVVKSPEKTDPEKPPRSPSSTNEVVEAVTEQQAPFTNEPLLIIEQAKQETVKSPPTKEIIIDLEKEFEEKEQSLEKQESDLPMVIAEKSPILVRDSPSTSPKSPVNAAEAATASAISKLEAFKKFQEIKDLQNKKCIEEIRSTYEQLINEIKYNSELKIREILQESLKEKKKLRFDFERQIVETKSKQWCSNCSKESIYYCCWNTSYCDEECQRNHWSKHLKTCARIGEPSTPAMPETFEIESSNEENHLCDEFDYNVGPTKPHVQRSSVSGIRAHEFDFNHHYQQQQHQQRILKQKRKISPHQAYNTQVLNGVSHQAQSSSALHKPTYKAYHRTQQQNFNPGYQQKLTEKTRYMGNKMPL